MFSQDGAENIINASNYNNQYFGSSNFTWDDSSQLTMQGQGFMYGYDAGGTRVWSQAPGQPQIIYIYDGDTLIGQISNTPGAPAYTAYTWGAAGLVSERLIGNNQSFWYAFGPQGETRQLTNSTGTVVDTYCYTAYGVPLSTAPDPNIFQFGGQVGYQTEVHSPGGTILCGARWYDPALGRWLSRDPIGYDGGADLYAYCGDNPVGGVDPSGLQASAAHGIEYWAYYWSTNAKAYYDHMAGVRPGPLTAKVDITDCGRFVRQVMAAADFDRNNYPLVRCTLGWNHVNDKDGKKLWYSGAIDDPMSLVPGDLLWIGNGNLESHTAIFRQFVDRPTLTRLHGHTVVHHHYRLSVYNASLWDHVPKITTAPLDYFDYYARPLQTEFAILCGKQWVHP